jgi:hypothetical protein
MKGALANQYASNSIHIQKLIRIGVIRPMRSLFYHSFEIGHHDQMCAAISDAD